MKNAYSQLGLGLALASWEANSNQTHGKSARQYKQSKNAHKGIDKEYRLL